MLKISSLMPRLLVVPLTVMLGSAAWAQQPPTVRIRGTIESVDGPTLMIKSREGADMKVRVTDNVVVVGAFVPFLKELKRRGQAFLVLEQDSATLKADELPFFRPAERAAEFLPDADVVLITGSTGLDDWEWGVTLLAEGLGERAAHAD